MNNLKTYLLYAGIAVTGLITGAILFGGGAETPQTLEEHIAETHTDEDGNIVYTCSMHPGVRQSEPGNCPICGMELIRAENDQSSGNPNALVMSQAALKLAEIETTPAREGQPVRELQLPGKVMTDQNLVSNVTAHFPGRVRDLYVDVEGSYVRKGERLASFYSPELIAAQQELLETVKTKAQNPVLYQAARNKLRFWEFPEQTIRQIEESGEIMTELDFFSPVSGFVSDIYIQREDHLKTGGLMYTIAKLDRVWVDLESYESTAVQIVEGDELTLKFLALPGEEFSGKVIYVDPFLDNRSRSVTVRAALDNPGQRLKPGMLAEATLKTALSEETAVIIPRSAVLWTGKRSVVYVKSENTEGEFAAREIELGARVGNSYVVVSGLSAGEEVVTNGTFKLDSAAQLADKLSMMNRNPGTGANRTGHEGHSMSSDQSQSSEPEAEDHSNHTMADMEASTLSPDEFRQQVKNTLSPYLALKNSLVSSEASVAAESAQEFLQALRGVDMTLVKGDMHDLWMKQLNVLRTQAEAVAESTDLKIQHAAFMKLSETLIQTINTFEIPGVIYQQFCPMANGGEGAYWLSSEEAVANPYYGDMMHNCGEVITRIEY